jgi:hypothetical protein
VLPHIRFTDSDWQRIARDWNAWWAGELDRPLVVLETSDPLDGADYSQLTRFGLDTPVDDMLDNWQRILEATHFHGDAFPKWWPNFGPGTMAAWQGSPITWQPDTTWFWPRPGAASLSDIHVAYDATNPWWLRVQEVTRRAVARWGDRVLVGIADIGGNLDILASLRGSERLLADLINVPYEVEFLAGKVTRLWTRYYDELYAITSVAGRGNACWGPCWSPGKGYMLQSDFSYMLSPHMFGRFVLPDLVACCDHLDYGFYHLDGKGEIPHLDQLISIERLRGIQWQPGDGQPKGDGWLPLLRRIRDGGKLCQVYVTCTGARTILRELGGKGFLMHIVDEKLTPDEADEFVQELIG